MESTVARLCEILNKAGGMEEKVQEFIRSRFPESILKTVRFRGEFSVYIRAESLVAVCNELMDDPELQINHLKDITAIDWLGHAEEEQGRFEIVYNLYSISSRFRLFLRVRLPGDRPQVDSLTSLWNGANWMEREVWDLFGVEFIGHPNLSKILTPDELEGHPLRRDYPLTYEVPQFSWNKDDPPEVIK